MFITFVDEHNVTSTYVNVQQWRAGQAMSATVARAMVGTLLLFSSLTLTFAGSF